MKISVNWCGKFLPHDKLRITEQSAEELFTMRGLEVEVHNRHASATNIVVGGIVSCAAHPQDEKLKVCAVDIGKEKKLSIVCGAPNAREGLLVAVGAEALQSLLDNGGVVVKDKPIKGIGSQGIIFSEKELGVGDDKRGIIVLDEKWGLTAGDNLAEHLSLADDVFELGVTPNRGDCLSHLGVAREIAAATGARLQGPAVLHNSDNAEQWPVRIDEDAASGCPYYGCLLLRDVDCGAPSPLWLRTLMERCGGRSVNAVVDVTNYLMLAYGQPLHAFDLDKLRGGIRVGYNKAGGTLAVLDGSTVRYPPDTLLINDDDGAVALAGVMGGADSGVTTQTRNILLEAAHFTPTAVRGRARQFGLNSDAAFRFERGVDATLPPIALTHAAQLIKDIGGGGIGKPSFAGAPPAVRAPLVVSPQRMSAALTGGDDISADEQASALHALQLPITTSDDGALSVGVPSWRFDLEQEADIIEEVARVRGYNRLPETIPLGGRLCSPPENKFSEAATRLFFTARGFYEVITYSFVAAAWEEQLSPQALREGAFNLLNPMNEEAAVMRSTLWGGLLDRARYNARHKQDSIRLFEIGRCFSPSFSPMGIDNLHEVQPLCLGGVMTGATPLHWQGGRRMFDFYDIKGALEQFFAPRRLVFVAPEAGEDDILHPGKSAIIKLEDDETVIGRVGELHPAQPFAAEFKSAPLLFSINNLEHLMATASRLGGDAVKISPVSHFPPVSRDFAVLVDNTTAGGALLSCARAAAKSHGVVDVQLFDFYPKFGDNRGHAGKSSYGFRLTLQGEEQNLRGEEINVAVDAVLQALQKNYGAVLREGSA